jgi:hypothetical protein
MDGTVIAGGGCHSGVQSSQPKDLQFTNQRMIYDKVMGWETPVKAGVAAVKAALANINAEITKSRLSTAQKAEVQLMANQAQEILTAVQKDGSWGVHAPSYTLKKLNEARLLTDGAQAALAGKSNTVALKK